MVPYIRRLFNTHEKFDTREIVEDQVRKLATAIRESNNVMAMTGAGVSTSAGIPDFRTARDTKLPYGVG